VPKGQ